MRVGRWLSCVACAGLLACAWARDAGAQVLEAPRARQGYYVALGTYVVAQTTWDDGKPQGTWPGRDLTIRLGQMLTPRFGLGLRIDSGGATHNDETSFNGGLGVEGQVNLWRNLTLHAGSGLGFVAVKDPNAPADDQTHGGYGAMMMMALSYDCFLTNRLTGGWALTPTVMARVLPNDSMTALWIGVGVQVTWWSGRPRNELVLPDSEAYKK